jgi:hypothetical protein
MFNVNSTSETAWRAILGHARGQKIPFLKETAGAISVSLSGETDYATSRFSVAGETNTSASALDGSSGTFNGANQFTGYRVFTNTMIDALAKEMVNQVRERGPFLSLSEFVNRQLSSGNLALAGAIQAALEKTPISDPNSPYSEISNILPREPATANPRGDGEEYEFSDAAVGESVFGLPGWTRQADILRPLAPTLTVRDDTFTIRAYGDARAKNGTDILATAVCEAVVRRTRDYVDPTDAADLATAPTSQQNKDFGRRFTIVSFRWLTPGEI